MFVVGTNGTTIADFSYYDLIDSSTSIDAQNIYIESFFTNNLSLYDVYLRRVWKIIYVYLNANNMEFVVTQEMIDLLFSTQSSVFKIGTFNTLIYQMSLSDPNNTGDMYIYLQAQDDAYKISILEYITGYPLEVIEKVVIS